MDEIVRMTGITKIYDNGALANSKVDFSLARGEIHAIAGENGAGKSTVMKILYGLEKPDEGTIEVDGKPVTLDSPADAVKLGIGMVHQHFMLVNELKVYENIFLGAERVKFGFLRRKAMREEAGRLAETYGMKLNVDAVTANLTVGEAQKAEILKVLARGARVLILDEPTAVLTPQETAELFAQLRLLRDAGHTVVIITHKLKEMKELCDRVTILRRGKSCGVYDVAGIDEEQLSRLMVGGSVRLKADKPEARPGETMAALTGVSVFRDNGVCALKDVSFSVRRGEILCLAGVEGNGQGDVVRCLTGTERGYQGSVRFKGREVGKLRPIAIRRMGQSHIPEDRMTTGIERNASIYDNLISVSAMETARLGFIRHRALKAAAEEQLARYRIKAKDIRQKMSMLSGGNMQKVVLARELDLKPDFLIADQPTRGVDVGAIAFIHAELVRMREAGCAILLVSADLSEVYSLADRILVFHAGEITAEIEEPESVSEEQLGRYMLGVERLERRGSEVRYEE